MTLPRILVVDDQFAHNAIEQMLFTQAVGLPIEKVGAGGTAKPYAEIVFCSGQRREGGRLLNDLPTVVEMLCDGDWALVLLDVQFDSGEIDANGRAIGLPGDDRFGLEIHRIMRADFPALPVIMLSGKRHEEISVGGTTVPYLSKMGLSPYELRRTLARYGELSPEAMRTVLELDDDVVAEAPKSLDVFRQAYLHAGADASILVLGESGVGKEVLARYLHRISARTRGPFVAVNVAAIPRDLVESELFGIGRSVATGVNGRSGRFEQASGGTLFLDEIGDMPLETQAKVLRALQERRVVRVGEAKEIEVDIRLVCATSRDLAKLTEANAFRADLLYRINTVPILISSLRERSLDIAPLCRRMLANCGVRQGKPGLSLSADAISLLEAQPFPGNVRELANLIERLASAAGQHQVIGKEAVVDVLAPTSAGARQRADAPVEISAAVAPAPVGAIGMLIDVIESLQVDPATSDLMAAKSRLDFAYGALMQRIAGAALERCRDPVGGGLNRQKAMQLLTGDMRLRGKGPGRVVNQILGRRLEDPVAESDLNLLVQRWKERTS